jgi:hypothetical protein
MVEPGLREPPRSSDMIPAAQKSPPAHELRSNLPRRAVPCAEKDYLSRNRAAAIALVVQAPTASRLRRLGVVVQPAMASA